MLTLVAVGSKISFSVNGIERIAVTDSSITGGDPGIMSFGAATADNWLGDDATGRTRRSNTRLAERCRGCPDRWSCRTTVATT